jgi:hypothetical protein
VREWINFYSLTVSQLSLGTAANTASKVGDDGAAEERLRARGVLLAIGPPRLSEPGEAEGRAVLPPDRVRLPRRALRRLVRPSQDTSSKDTGKDT